MHGPDGTDYPNASVSVAVDPPERVVFDHVSGPRFEKTITLLAQGARTLVGWRQRFRSPLGASASVRIGRGTRRARP